MNNGKQRDLEFDVVIAAAKLLDNVGWRADSTHWQVSDSVIQNLKKAYDDLTMYVLGKKGTFLHKDDTYIEE